MSDDLNADLIGYQFVNESAGGSVWRVVATDPILGGGYVQLRQVHPDSGHLMLGALNVRVQNAATVRRRKEIETERATVTAC